MVPNASFMIQNVDSFRMIALGKLYHSVNQIYRRNQQGRQHSQNDFVSDSEMKWIWYVVYRAYQDRAGMIEINAEREKYDANPLAGRGRSAKMTSYHADKRRGCHRFPMGSQRRVAHFCVFSRVTAPIVVDATGREMAHVGGTAEGADSP
jgi:hypothetical protein